MENAEETNIEANIADEVATICEELLKLPEDGEIKRAQLKKPAKGLKNWRPEVKGKGVLGGPFTK